MASTFVIVVVAFVVPFFVLGVVGNIGVLLCVLTTPSLRTRANAIIVSLTSSCLAFLLMVVPFTLDSFLHTQWRFADWYCHASAYLSFAFIGITVYNIAALSIYRYFCVVHPLKLSLRSITALTLLISLAWLIPITTQTLIALCQLANTKYIPEYSRCVLIKVGKHSALYNALVLGGFLPSLGLTLYSYAGIYCRVRGSAKRLRRIRSPKTAPLAEAARSEQPSAEPRHDGVSHQAPTHSPAVGYRGGNREQNYLTKICVVVFLLFMACYGPMIILTIIYANTSFPAQAYLICTVVYWLGSCLHPLVYATLQPQIRRSFLRLVRCCFKSTDQVPGVSTVMTTQSSVEEQS